MNKANLEIIEVNVYYEKARISTKNVPLKIAVLKVKYSDDSNDIIFRYLLNHRKILSEINIEGYKSLELKQLKQVIDLINEKDKYIIQLYLKKYFNTDLNIKFQLTNSILKLNIEDKRIVFLNKIKNLFQHIKYNINSRSTANI